MIITSKIIWRGTPIITISPAQPFHLIIAALHQHHNVICLSITSIHFFSSLSLGAKKQMASLISKQTVTCIFLHSIHSYLPKKVPRHRRFFLFLFFTTELASLFFTWHSQKTIVHSRTRQLSPGTCALIHTCIYKTPFLSSLLSRSPGQLMFSYDFLVLYHDKFTAYLFAVFFAYCHTLLFPCFLFFIKCITSNDAQFFFFFFSPSHLKLITVTTRYALCFSYYVAHLLSAGHLL